MDRWKLEQDERHSRGLNATLYAEIYFKYSRYYFYVRCFIVNERPFRDDTRNTIHGKSCHRFLFYGLRTMQSHQTSKTASQKDAIKTWKQISVLLSIYWAYERFRFTAKTLADSIFEAQEVEVGERNNSHKKLLAVKSQLNLTHLTCLTP